MYTDIPEWTDYVWWWGRVAVGIIGCLGIIGGLLYLFNHT